MNKLLPKLFSPVALLYTYLILTSMALGSYRARGVEAPDAFAVILPLGYLWIVGWWLLTDSRERGVAWPWDLGLFLHIAWPFIMPYYLLKTRGLRGLLVVLIFVGVYTGALLFGLVLYLAIAT